MHLPTSLHWPLALVLLQGTFNHLSETEKSYHAEGEIQDSTSMSEDQLFHAKAGAGASNTISSNCHVRVYSFEPCRGKCQVTLGCYFRGVIGAP